MWELRFDPEKLKSFDSLSVSKLFSIEEKGEDINLKIKEQKDIICIDDSLSNKFNNPDVTVSDFIYSFYQNEIIIQQDNVPIYHESGIMTRMIENVRLGTIKLEDTVGYAAIRDFYNPIHELFPYKSLLEVDASHFHILGEKNIPLIENKNVIQTRHIITAYVTKEFLLSTIKRNSIISYYQKFLPNMAGEFTFKTF